MKKTHITKDKEVIILISDKEIMDWYFDYEGFNELDALIYKKRFEDLINLISLSSKFFLLSNIIIKYKNYHYNIEATYEAKLKEHFDVFKKDVEKLGYSKIEFEFIGKCKVGEVEHVNCEIFKVSFERNNSISLSISTKNLSFLPHNPISKKKQFILWTYNAPGLAKMLAQFSQLTDLLLIMEDGEFFKSGGKFYKEHPFYIGNAIIHDKVIDFDELYIPFDLLE